MAQMLKLKKTYNAKDTHWDPEQVLTEALAERTQFLENRPQYKPFQSKIDRMMDNAGNSQARMAILAIMIEGKLVELYGQLRQLNGILIHVIE